VVCRWYEIEGFRFGIRSTSAAFSAWLDEALAAYRSPRRRDDNDRDATYSVVIEEPEPDGSQRRFHILYLGGWDIVRTLDLRLIAERVLWDVESILYPVRDDAVYLEVGAVDVGGALGIVPSYLVPALNRSKRRAERYGVRVCGGVYVVLELGTGMFVPPDPALDVSDDALASLSKFMTVPDRVELELFTDRRPIDLMFEQKYDEERDVWQPSRADVTQALLTRVRNLHAVDGAALETLAAAVRRAEPFRGWYGSTNEMYERLVGLTRAVRSS
jgi:hypothetical protein